MKDNDMIFTITDENGEEVTCEILFTFEHQETHKNYVIYTDDSLDENGNTRVFASVYNPDEDMTKLLPVETEEEWSMIEAILDELMEEQEF